MALINLVNPTNDNPANPTFPSSAIAVVKSDADTYSGPVTVYVGTTGDVSVVPWGGQAAVLFKAVPAGTCVPCQVAQVRTATTAADMVAIY